MLFLNDAKLQSVINNTAKQLLHDKYTGELRPPKELNSIDKKELADELATVFLKEYIDEYLEKYNESKKNNDKDDKSDKNNKDNNKEETLKQKNKNIKDELVLFASTAMDKLIPKMYYLEVKKELCERYNPLLVRRIFDINGKDDLDETQDFVYQFEHDFTTEREVLKCTAASDKQISYLRYLGEKLGYLLWNEKYLSKAYANQMIEYLSEKTYEEPKVFDFFFVAK